MGQVDRPSSTQQQRRKQGNGHRGTYRRHWVVVVLRDGETVVGRFESNTGRHTEIQVAGGKIRRLAGRDIVRLSAITRAVAERIRVGKPGDRGDATSRVTRGGKR